MLCRGLPGYRLEAFACLVDPSTEVNQQCTEAYEYRGYNPGISVHVVSYIAIELGSQRAKSNRRSEEVRRPKVSKSPGKCQNGGCKNGRQNNGEGNTAQNVKP